MIRTPVNTAICLGSSGSYCISEFVLPQIDLDNSLTTIVSGNGNIFTPFKVEVKIDNTAGNALSVTGLGLYVSATSSDIIDGTYTTTGDGFTAQFSWLHGLGFNPTATGFIIDPISAAAQGIYSKSADSLRFYVNYDVCPVGTLTYNTTVKLP